MKMGGPYFHPAARWAASDHPLRPWLFDIAAALVLIAACVAGFAGLGFAADYLHAIGWIN